MEPLNDRRSWNYEDRCPGVPLAEIEPMSARIDALARRSTSPLLQEHFLQLAGAIEILEGIEHHHAHFERALRELAPRDGRGQAVLRHEAIAWLNRVGQFRAFARSKVVRESLGSFALPTIDALSPFRDKHAAHRSVDMPRKEDTEDLMLSHMLALSTYSGTRWTPRPGCPTDQARWPTPPVDTHFLAFELQVDDGHGGIERVDLILERDHPAVMQEAFDLFGALLR